MNSLRVRIAVLLAAFILVIGGLIALAAELVLGPPGPPHAIEPVARQVLMLETLASGGDAKSIPELIPSPSLPAGRLNPMLTDWLRRTLHHMRADLDVQVLRPPPPGADFVAIPVAGRGWLSMPLPDLPPPGGFFGPLLQYLAVITATALVVALLVSYRLTRPLALLEDAVAQVGPDATLPHLPERGPAEVRATASALNRLSDRLKAAVESRMRLVAAAGHDLRTPMTRMRLRAEFLEPEEERNAWLADLEELERIADSAIALVREETAPERAEIVRLDDLARAVVADLSAQGFAVSASTVEPASIRAPRLAMARALRNLLINGATHGQGARISLAADRAEAVLRVEDDGPGLPEDQLAHAFEPFFRSEPGRAKSLGGAGLGLSIANEIVTRAGGSLRLANRRPHGLLVEARLPIAAMSAG